ncbi:MAG: ROK family protein [Marmoricola sp.]
MSAGAAPAGPTVGVDIGGSKVLALLVEDGRVLDRAERITPERSTAPGVVEDVLVEAVRSVGAGHRIRAVGVGAAGLVDRDRRVVRFAPHLSWRDEPLADRLEERLGVRVVLDNDANAALWAEHRFGAARDHDDVVLVALGTGIGGALLRDGRLVRGRNGMAGEFGHAQVVPGGRPCPCGRSGCWEQYCSGRALARFTAEAGVPREGSGLTAAAAAGDPVALSAFAEVGRWLGVGIAGLVAALDPELVVVAGGVSAAGELLLGPARAAYEASLLAGPFRQAAPVVAGELGPEAGALGAADLAAR